MLSVGIEKPPQYHIVADLLADDTITRTMQHLRKFYFYFLQNKPYFFILPYLFQSFYVVFQFTAELVGDINRIVADGHACSHHIGYLYLDYLH
jgi:hypothetical protein